MSLLPLVIFISLLCCHVLLTSATSARVSTKQGYVLGTLEVVQFLDGPQYTLYKFLGIPYAQKPIGNLRFQRPQPLRNRRPRDYDATSYRPVCLQFVKGNPYIDSIKRAWPGFTESRDMREDCLYLNIYTPSTSCAKRYPVMVHIHGGSYVAGTPIRDISPGEYLPRHDVVLVTIQYRLGAFGFFTTGDSEAPGNLGLLDQIEALKWIQNNINGFCGDKSRVTLLGESVGGSSVSLHYLSPLSRGLFHRGIAVSGNALAPFAFKPKSTVLKASKTLTKGLNCENQNSQLTVQCLRSKTSDAIVKSNKDFLNVQPFVDNYFLTDEPRKLLKEGTFQKLPLISGFVSNEGVNAFSGVVMRNIPEYQNYLDKTFFQKFLHFTKQQAPNAFDALAFQYTPWGDLQRPEAYRKNVTEMLSDYILNAPTHAFLSFHSDQSADAYMFEFAHRSRHHPGESWRGVEHEDTTAYKFGLPLLRSARTNLHFDNVDREVSKKFVTLFTNFAKSGSPNTPVSVRGVQWNPFDKSSKAYLKIQRSPAMTSKYHPLRMAFWNSYFPTLFPCMERKSWYGQCKKSKVAKQPQSPKKNTTSGSPNLERVLW